MKTQKPVPAQRAVLKEPDMLQAQLKDNGTIPNSNLPLVLYGRVFRASPENPALFEELFASNNWTGCWRDGIYPYHHYHSNAHEVLGVVRGSARVQFGGEGGTIQSVAAGDIIIIPAGVAHKNLGSSPDFLIVGAYPDGQEPDMCYGQEGERPKTDANIARVPLPARDPVYGPDGPLLSHWAGKRKRGGI